MRACIELSTVGSPDAESFVSCCGRFVDGAGYQAFISTPTGNVGNLQRLISSSAGEGVARPGSRPGSDRGGTIEGASIGV